jgi:hypothetical protein
VPNYRAPRACRADRHKINTRPFFLYFLRKRRKIKKEDAAERATFPSGAFPKRNKKGRRKEPSHQLQPPNLHKCKYRLINNQRWGCVSLPISPDDRRTTRNKIREKEEIESHL